ncbi:MarR family winged helix-turn-helix transcriptional regulator [Desulfolithobacter sp.]
MTLENKEPDAALLRKQARYIFTVGKMVRRHLLQGLASGSARGGDCCHGELSLAQLNLLLTVRGQQELTLTELADLLGVSPPSVSVMVERLVDKGLLVRERSTADRRKVVISLSPDAMQDLDRIEEQMIAAFVDLVRDLGPETARQWYGVLQQVEKVLLQRIGRLPAGVRGDDSKMDGKQRDR